MTNRMVTLLKSSGIPDWAFKQYSEEILLGVPNYYIKNKDGSISMVKKLDTEPTIQII